MRKRFSDIKNSKLFTADDMGLRAVAEVIDLLVEDGAWNVRYLVVSTDAPLTRRVLISPAAIQGFDLDKKSIETSLTTQQVLESPHIDCDQPISRQYEQALVDYYGWPIYWIGRAVMTPQSLESVAADEVTDSINHTHYSNLRSANEVCGYQIQSQNGPAGRMQDLVIQLDSWIVDYATAESGSWLPEESSMFSTSQISQVDWSSRRLMVDLSKTAPKPASPRNDRPVITGEPISSQPFRTA